MRKSLRKSGIDIIGDVPWGTHICQFYQTKEDLTDILVPYFEKGLENNELCLWVTSQPLKIEDAKEALREVVPDLNVFLQKGQLEIISYNDWFLTEGVFDPEKVSNGCAEKLNYASHNGYEGVRLSGNNSWLDKENWDSFIKFKEQMDNVIGNCRMIVLCTYSLDRHAVDEISYLGVNHQFTLVKSNGKWKLIESSKRKIAEETAVRATKNWEHTFDAVPDLIAIIDTSYRVVRANSAMASKLGVTREECIGLTCYRVVHGMTRPPSFCPHMQLLKDGFEHTAEVCEDCLGGFFIVSVSPLYDSEGKLTGSIHVARDINERRQMEEALRVSEEKYRNLIETASEGIFLMNDEFEITYANKIIGEMMGYTQEEIIGRPVMDFIPDESKPIAKRSLENRRHGIIESYESKLICKDGSPFWVFISFKPLFNKDGDFTGSLCMFTDISERKQSEKALQESEIHFRTLAENSPDIITRFDRQYRHIYANPAAVESYGISLDEIIGKTQGELGRETKKVKSWEVHLESSFVTGKTETMEYYIWFQGGKKYFNTKIVSEFVGGEVISVLAISREITDIKEAEAKLKVTLDNSENLVKERTEELQKAYNLLKESEKGLAEAQRMAHIGNLDWNLVNGEVNWSYELYRLSQNSNQFYNWIMSNVDFKFRS
jgi:PAS domain S-box-containing protein